MKQVTTFLVAAATALLVGCGGGGDSASNAPTIDLSLVHNDRTVLSYSISGWYGSPPITVTGSQSLSYGAVSDTTLNGAPAKTQGLSYTNTINSTVYTFAETIYFDPATGHDLAILDSELGPNPSSSYNVYSTFTAPTVAAGSTGPLYTTTRYTDSTLATKIRHAQASYAAFPDSDTSLLVVYTTQTFDNNNTPTSRSMSTYRVTTAGIRTKLKQEDINFGADGKTAVLDYVYTPQ